MSDAYMKVKDNGAQGLALVREETDTSVSELKAQIDDLTESVGDITGNMPEFWWSAWTNQCIDLTNTVTIVDGVLQPYTTSSSTKLRYIVIEVTEGEIYTVTATGKGTRARTYGFVRADGTVQYAAPYNNSTPTVLNNAKITIPAGVKYLVVNDGVGDGKVFSGNPMLVETVNGILPFFDLETPYVSGYIINPSSGNITENALRGFYEIDVSALAGSSIAGFSPLDPSPNYGLAFYDMNGEYISGSYYTGSGNHKWTISETVPVNAAILRITAITAERSQFYLSYNWGTSFGNFAKNGSTPKENDEKETRHDLVQAKHHRSLIADDVNKRLVLVHFSDIHSDKLTLKRIVDDVSDIGYDDIICTGDMVSNVGGEIESWWDENVLTCIGNHDSATYDSDSHTYTWNALTAAQRYSNYIYPFKNSWGATTTENQSYYYKDYTDCNVRLIVMDAMIYYPTFTGTHTDPDAVAQNNWLEGLLAGAISAGYHVMIAIHAPYNTASSVDCSFSRYNQGDANLPSDCQLPECVVNIVDSAINGTLTVNGSPVNGNLNFIGYLTGHTHFDNIWKTTANGKQLIYTITCASTDPRQWKAYCDMFRNFENDAYNIIVVDTQSTLVKIIRGGGANIDNRMRARKAICFDYAAMTKCGEIL